MESRRVIPFARFVELAKWNRSLNIRKVIKDNSASWTKIGKDILFTFSVADYESYWLCDLSSSLVYNLPDAVTEGLLAFSKSFIPTIENRYQRGTYSHFLSILHAFDSGYDTNQTTHQSENSVEFQKITFRDSKGLPIRYFLLDSVEPTPLISLALEHVKKSYPTTWEQVQKSAIRLHIANTKTQLKITQDD